jgi:uncharacterized protein (TIGR02646 family)
MIQITRTVLESRLVARLDKRTSQLKAINATQADARRVWASARPERRGIHAQLAAMAAGIERCMYCGDNLGTDIDHFEPISHAPTRAFDWLNHLLACSHCNSNQKRNLYPCDSAGASLLIDPTCEDPYHHFRLILTTGEYRHLTLKGKQTIEVFGLNRYDLKRGRATAFVTRRAIVCQAQSLLDRGQEAEAILCLRALAEEPHASVLYAMLSLMGEPNAEEVLGADVVAALANLVTRRLIAL